jgi:outer membrane protein assembly factor BamB
MKSRTAAAALATLASLHGLFARAGDWPQWRGPGATAVSDEKGLPLEWSETRNVLWKTPIPGRGHSSPIVSGNRIFLTTSIEGPVVPGAKAKVHIRAGQEFVHPDSVGADHSYTLDLICLDRDTGKVLWQRTAYQGTVYDNRHRKNTYASSTPVADGRRVFAFFEAEGLYCYDFEGKLLWKTSVGRIAKMGMGPGTSPVLFRDLVIVQCDQEDGGEAVGSFIAGIDTNTGREVWRTPRHHRKSHATPLLLERERRTELVASGWESIIAYDPASGHELWRSGGLSGYGIPSPVAGHGLVFLSAGYPDKKTVAIRPGGSGDVSATHVAWSYDKGSAYVPSPILYGDYLYLMTDKGLVTCLDARTGAVQYEGGRPPAPATFSASPVAFAGFMLFASEDGDMYLVQSGPSHAVARTNSMGEPIFASPAIAAGRLFIRTARHLFAIGTPAAP